MTGLLDALQTGQWTQDPEQNKLINQGLLQFGLSMMSGKGKLGEIIGNSGLSTLQGLNQYKNQQFQEQMRKHQLAQIEREKQQQKQQEEFRGSLVSPQMQASQTALAGGSGPTVENAAKMAPVDPNAQMMFGAMKAGQIAPLDYVKMIQKDSTPIKLGRDERLLTPTGKEIIGAAPEKDPEQIRLLKSIYGDGTPAYRSALELLGAKATSHPPAANIKIDNKLGEGLAKEVGPMIADSAQRAQGAQQQISNAETIIRAVDTNKIYAGPGANIRLKGAQIGQMLGVGGKDAAETVANTRSIIQGLARATVAARGALKGQGQVSDFEGKLLAKAESGDIEDMTPAEIRYIAGKNKEYGTKLIEQHSQLIKKAKNNRSTAGIADFFDVPQSPNQTLDWGALPNGR